jgi:hypothetical protein
MAIPWYEWRHIRNRLLSCGRAVQGVSPYRTVLEPDKSKCSSGYTNFSKRLIMVNPTIFETSPAEQYRLTKAVLCHEAGHRRFMRRGLQAAPIRIGAVLIGTTHNLLKLWRSGQAPWGWAKAWWN